MSPAEADAKVGSEILGYRIEAVLGRGGMGVVYRASDPRLKRKVALKLMAAALTDDKRFRARFLSECELAASLDHPNIVPIYDAGELDGQLYIAMRYVEGGDLRDLLATEGPLSPERSIAIVSHVGNALDAAHESGLVHRDVKPSNVLLDRRGHAYLADFGLTKSAGEESALTSDGQMLGTVSYIAPEQIRGDRIDGRADVYALGCVLYECLAGEVPFARGTELATVYAHLEEAPPRLSAVRPGLPPAIDDVLARALAKSPSQRYATVAEFVEAARAALAVEGVGLPGSRRRLLAGVAAVLVAVAIAAALGSYFALRDSEQPSVGRLVRIDPSAGGVTSTMRVGDDPRAVAFGDGRIWVASFEDATLWQVDPATGEARNVPAVGRPRDLIVFRGAAYVASDGPGIATGNLSKYDARTAGRLDVIEQLIVCSLAAGAQGLWIAGCPNVQQVSVQPFAVARTVPLPYQEPLSAANYREALVDMAVGNGVWVLGDAADRRLWRIDPRSGRISATLELPFAPAGIAVGEGAIWVTAQLDDVVARIDPASGRIVRTIPVGRGASAVAAGGGSVWVAESIDGSVSRIDPKTNELTRTIRVGGVPMAIAVGGGSVWVGIRRAT